MSASAARRRDGGRARSRAQDGARDGARRRGRGGLAPVLALLGLALGLGGCSSGDDTVFERVVPALEERLFGGPLLGEAPAQTVPAEITRAQLDLIPYAIIAISVAGGPRSFVVPVADNGGYLVFQDAARRSVVLHGALVTATDGLGRNLAEVVHAPDDPLVRATPLPAWPGRLARSYGFIVTGRPDYRIAVECALARGPRERIEIVERLHETVRVTETCANQARSFANTHWVDPETGFVWKTEQWAGPDQPPLTIEIVRPYKPA